MRRSRARSILTTITFLSVLAAMGCGTNNPVSPSQDISTMPGVENPLFVELSTSRGTDRPMIQSSPVTGVISADEGGIISNGYFNLYFPPGALDEDTEISISMPRFPEAVVELGPHGIQFNKEVVLSLPVNDVEANINYYTVLWYNEESKIWEDIGANVENDIIKAKLNHFSDYGIPNKI